MAEAVAQADVIAHALLRSLAFGGGVERDQPEGQRLLRHQKRGAEIALGQKMVAGAAVSFQLGEDGGLGGKRLSASGGSPFQMARNTGGGSMQVETPRLFAASSRCASVRVWLKRTRRRAIRGRGFHRRRPGPGGTVFCRKGAAALRNHAFHCAVSCSTPWRVSPV